MADLSTTFAGVRFQNPFLLSSAPPTESESNIMRAFDAGWGGVVTKTIGLHPVVNVVGPKTKFLRADPDSPHLSMKKRPGAALHSSWNWELISDKTLDWWVPRLGRIKRALSARSTSQLALINCQLRAKRETTLGIATNPCAYKTRRSKAAHEHYSQLC